MPTLVGEVRSPTGPVTGFDTDTVLTDDTAAAFYAYGYRFCVRYLSHQAESGSTLSNDEAQTILNAGLALMPVQRVLAAGWAPSAELGTQFGAAAAANAATVGFPAGVNVWCDLEGIHSGTGPDAVIAYCHSWYAQVLQAGYVPGLYVGAGAVLNPSQLEELPFAHYWKSESTTPAVEKRGYQMFQSEVASNVHGIAIDKDMTGADALGGQVLWLAPP